MCSAKVTIPAANRVLKSVTDRQHFAALDALRGLAALSVTFYHVSWMNPTESLHYVRNSYLMVDVFFVLSGFVIFYAYHERLGTIDDVRRFVWLRFWRIYPLHFTFLIVFVFIEVLKFAVEWRYGIKANHPAFEQNSASAFFKNLFLIQALHTSDTLTFNEPAWSISTEFCAYVLFAAVAYVFRVRVAILLASGVLCATGFALLIALGSRGVQSTYDFGIIRCLVGFFLGVLVYALYDLVRTKRLVREHPILCGRVAILSMLSFVAFLASKTPGYSDLCIYPLSAAVILTVALSPKTSATRFLYLPPLQWLGAISYSLYMAHDAVLWFVKVFLRFGTDAQDVWLPFHDIPVLQTSSLYGTIGAIAGVVLVLVIAQLTYAWIEIPFRNWSRRTRKPQVGLSGDTIQA